MTDLINWLIKAIKAIFTDVWEMISDLFVEIFDIIFLAITSLISAIPVPDFLSDGLQGLFSGLPSSLLFFINATGFDNALLVLGSGVAFRLIRKLLTLGQW